MSRVGEASALQNYFHIGSEIGRGRFGTVYHCSSSSTGEPYALKSIHKSSISDPLDLDCIQKEAKFTRLVSGHPNVVSLHGSYEDDDSLHLVLDLCSGPDLYGQITQNRSSPITEQEAAAVMRQLMEAIAHCHRRGMAHRDVKPDNVLFDRRGRLRLADFGSAGWFGDGKRMSGLVGTPYYVAPEVVAGREYGENVDVWSAGVVMYIMLGGGMPPFYWETAVEVFEAVVRGNLRFPTRVFHGVSAEAKDLMRKMMCKDVNRRLSAQQVLQHPWIVAST